MKTLDTKSALFDPAALDCWICPTQKTLEEPKRPEPKTDGRPPMKVGQFKPGGKKPLKEWRSVGDAAFDLGLGDQTLRKRIKAKVLIDGYEIRVIEKSIAA